MRVGGRGAWALVVAAVLGTVAGLTTAFVVGDPPGEGPAGSEDPLRLGIPLVNQDCTGESILVVGWGDGRAPLDAGVAANTGEDLHYLRTEDSCSTLYGPPDRPVPEYAVYLGPYDTLREGCEQRLSLEHKGDNLTNLNAGNEIFVKCLCVLSSADAPVLRPGMVATASEGIWIRGLQGMLNDIDRLGDDEITGAYDERTAAVIRGIQANAAIPADGVVDGTTWRVLQDRACGSYDY